MWPLFLSRRANSNQSPGLPFTSTLVLLFRVLGTFSTTGSFVRESLLVIFRVWCVRDGFGGHLGRCLKFSHISIYCPPTESDSSGANLYMIHVHPTSYTQACVLAYLLACIFPLGSVDDRGSGTSGLGSLAAYQRNVQSLSPALAVCICPHSRTFPAI